MTGRAAEVLWFVLAGVGLVGTWTFNVLSIAAGRDYLGDWLGSGPSVSSLVVDVVVVLLACWVLMLVEARRLGIRHVWVYLVLAPVVALAFALPLFLAVRERRLRELRVAPADLVSGRS
ncbi:DUF2834 domain-containing protein [Desertihabitans brevis]|uniref:DUF2834 domain-containing protein n=1 Tax=Desertihabitans brevis TaxID=2268447 RepID=UPI0018F4CF54|nr:DUF2834 domain-containing protein [Desertihabitans brevis]